MTAIALPRPARGLTRNAIVLVVLAVFVLLTLAAIGFGSTWIPLETVANVLVGGGEKTEKLVVLQLRLPRVAAAGIGGAAIAFAGYLLQRITRNELASPGVLGVVDGAALGVVAFMAIFSNDANAMTVSIAWQPLAAIIGALSAITLVFLLSGRQASSAIRLLLFGIAIAAVAKALTTILMLVGPIYQAAQASRWLAGSVNAVNWTEIQLMLMVLVPTAIVACIAAVKLPPADLDDISSRSIGLNLPVYRIFIFLLAALLTAGAVAFVGGVSFIGLIAPHLARMLVGRARFAGIVTSLLLGAIILIGADLLVRVAFAPMEIPAGTITAVIGAPYFLYLLMRKDKTNG
ncbi:iron ABC transporter permease [Devosia sp. 63-57]|mgnify:FL=1|uniref:FecCD family ABC transporter permease n=1 Tax=Devosia sp. 63-57 TaxID=1895751 RepID=UPI00086DACE4|nr:iron ABC transporter permease [Devosia sp. 63-57]ODT47259.1 MAG: iron ABC transporter permease [Pelagibacterium sp. SCN 63-126]ODU89077.1 MAG: iron ABC transporter permease [Pelagibacterium sp. SCN 63-17]OJX43031.1 MAG: iron ABC transporter permease [Devosia sp. 63-57]